MSVTKKIREKIKVSKRELTPDMIRGIVQSRYRYRALFEVKCEVFIDKDVHDKSKVDTETFDNDMKDIISHHILDELYAEIGMDVVEIEKALYSKGIGDNDITNMFSKLLNKLSGV